ncbi:MAG: DUF47 family protein [Methanomicrobiales archaeon]|nr:DUF47 family protein [Methanomicrobiales archaeon]
MSEKNSESEKKTKPNIFNLIFPRKYNFEEMLAEQADKTLTGVETLVIWLNSSPLSDPVHMVQIEEEVDAMRHRMEDKLINSFSTPFDRQDIYDLSRQMDYLLNFSKETAIEMYTFGVGADKTILAMAEALLRGCSFTVKGVKIMNTNKNQVEDLIRKASDADHEIETLYVAGMAELFRTDNPMDALKKREIYHHLRDAGRALRRTLDILHHAVVGLV